MDKDYKRIICFPGGGVRGIISAIILKRLVASKTIDLEKIDVFSGTSTGMILAACLVKPNPYSLDEIESLFKEFSQKIFSTPWYCPNWMGRAVFGAGYDHKKLAEVINNALGDVRVGDCPKKFVGTVYSLDEAVVGTSQRAAMPVFIHNLGNPFHMDMLDLKLADVVIGASSAPAYFYPHRFKHGGHWHKYIDGGLIDNSSCLGALGIVTHEYTKGSENTENIAMLSIGNGNGYWRDDAAEPSTGWRVPRTAATVINTIVQGGSMLSVSSMQNILGSRYHNVNSTLPREIDLADYKAIDELVEFAETQDLSQVIQWCRAYFY